MSKVVWTEEMVATLRELYPENGAKYCADLLKLRKQQVTNKVKKLGLKISKKRHSKIQSERSTKYYEENFPEDVTHTLFSSSHTKETSYLLGLLWADGSLQKKSKNVRLELVTKDMQQLKKVFNTTGKWSYTERQRENRQQQSIYSTRNKNLYDFLAAHNYENKSVESACSILSILPKKLHHYWWRGFFDGDGSIYVSKDKIQKQVKLAGSYHQNWTFAETLLEEVGISFKVKRVTQKSGKYSIVQFNGIKSCQLFAQYIYQNYDEIGLQRKYNKFKLIGCVV